MRQELQRIVIDGEERPVVMDTEARRFELEARGAMASIEFKRHGHALALVHTEVPTALRGERLADQLAKTALDYARTEQLLIEPYCPFVAAYIKRHGEYADLVRPGFDPPA